MNETIQYIWQQITNCFTLYAFFFMLFIFIVKCLFISVYFSLIYFALSFIKKYLHTRMSVRANYYSWYVLLFSIVLVNLGDHKTQLYNLYGMATAMPYAYVTGCVLAAVWGTVFICKLTAYILLSYKIKKSFKSMEAYDDSEGLAERAVLALGLRRKPDIMIACYIETPVSYGVFKKTVLLPDNYEEKYSRDELYFLLLHEMTHIKQGDTAKLHLVSLAECFLWVTPAMRLFIKNFKRDSEIRCDNRVIGLQGSERETYGNLILKECADRNTSMGFGFSDSYNALSNRLDALYRYKPEKHKRVSIAVITMMIFLLISSVSYFFSSNYLTLNYSPEFEVMLTNAESTDVEVLSSDAGDDAYYKVSDDNIRIDKRKLGELVSGFAGGEYDRICIFSSLYAVYINENTFIGRGNMYVFRFDELTDNRDSSRYYTRKLDQLAPMEALFLQIASKL